MKDDQILYNRPFIELGESEGRTLQGIRACQLLRWRTSGSP